MTGPQTEQQFAVWLDKAYGGRVVHSVIRHELLAAFTAGQVSVWEAIVAGELKTATRTLEIVDGLDEIKRRIAGKVQE